MSLSWIPDLPSSWQKPLQCMLYNNQVSPMFQSSLREAGMHYIFTEGYGIEITQMSMSIDALRLSYVVSLLSSPDLLNSRSIACRHDPIVSCENCGIFHANPTSHSCSICRYPPLVVNIPSQLRPCRLCQVSVCVPFALQVVLLHQAIRRLVSSSM